MELRATSKMDGEKQDLSREEDIYTVPLTKVIMINHHYNQFSVS